MFNGAALKWFDIENVFIMTVAGERWTLLLQFFVLEVKMDGIKQAVDVHFIHPCKLFLLLSVIQPILFN